MLPDSFFLWETQFNDSLGEAVDFMKPVFKNFRWPNSLSSPMFGNLLEFCAYQCRLYNVSPHWLMVSAQREQSCFRGPDPVPDDAGTKAMQAWLGVVGQDVGRTTKPGYLGLFPQVSRFCDTSAWLLGSLPSDCWRQEVRAGKQVRRYLPGRTVSVQKNGEQMVYSPLSAGEYMVLSFTPHLDDVGAEGHAFNNAVWSADAIAKKLGLFS